MPGDRKKKRPVIFTCCLKLTCVPQPPATTHCTTLRSVFRVCNLVSLSSAHSQLPVLINNETGSRCLRRRNLPEECLVFGTYLILFFYLRCQPISTIVNNRSCTRRTGAVSHQDCCSAISRLAERILQLLPIGREGRNRTVTACLPVGSFWLPVVLRAMASLGQVGAISIIVVAAFLLFLFRQWCRYGAPSRWVNGRGKFGGWRIISQR